MLVTILGIISIAVGLVSFGYAYLSVVRKRPAKIAWTFGILGVVCLTLIPVILAVFFAATTNA